MDYEQKLFLEELNALLDKYQVKIEGWHEMRVARENTLPIPKE